MSRTQNENLESQSASLKAKVETLEAQMKPQELSILQLRADVEALEEEVRLVCSRSVGCSVSA